MNECIGNKIKSEITIHVSQLPGDLVIFIPKEHAEAFKQLVNRAMNCWDRAPAELKEFADMVTEGKILQDYSSQEK